MYVLFDLTLFLSFFSITALAASGGTGVLNSETSKGAYVNAKFNLTEGDEIYMLVGQKGESACSPVSITLWGLCLPVADPGFLRRGPGPRRVCHLAIFFFKKKRTKIEKAKREQGRQCTLRNGNGLFGETTEKNKNAEKNNFCMSLLDLL